MAHTSLLHKRIIVTPQGKVEIREDKFLEIVSRISLSRKERLGVDLRKKATTSPTNHSLEKEDCIFCPANISKHVKLDINGKTYKKEECIIFFNKYPFASHHLVGILSREHHIKEFTSQKFCNILSLIEEYWEKHSLDSNYTLYLNMNHSPHAGASQEHPHVQIYIEDAPSKLHAIIEKNKKHAKKWKKEHKKEGLLLEYSSTTYIINFSPLGNHSITVHFPYTDSLDLLRNKEKIGLSIEKILSFYTTIGKKSFNFTIFPTKIGTWGFFITRGENRISDRGFMETLLREIVVETYPGETASLFFQSISPTILKKYKASKDK